MIALEILDLALLALLITLRIGLWVCLAYANPPWPVTRPLHQASTESSNG